MVRCPYLFRVWEQGKSQHWKDDREQTPGRPDPGGTCSAAGCSGDEERNLKTGSEKDVSRLCASQYGDEWRYLVRCPYTRGVTGFVGPGSKPVPLTEEEMMPLGIQKPDIEVDFAEGDMVVVTGGAWKDTAGVITGINMQKQTVTINVELFGLKHR